VTVVHMAVPGSWGWVFAHAHFSALASIQKTIGFAPAPAEAAAEQPADETMEEVGALPADVTQLINDTNAA
jgi:hypothetical protein